VTDRKASLFSSVAESCQISNLPRYISAVPPSSQALFSSFLRRSSPRFGLYGDHDSRIGPGLVRTRPERGLAASEGPFDGSSTGQFYNLLFWGRLWLWILVLGLRFGFWLEGVSLRRFPIRGGERSAREPHRRPERPCRRRRGFDFG